VQNTENSNKREKTHTNYTHKKQTVTDSKNIEKLTPSGQKNYSQSNLSTN